MKVTIIENEIYFAQSISLKLNRQGFETEVFRSVNDALRESSGEIYLLSTAIARENINILIKKFKSKIIILMVNIFNHTKTFKSLSYGADDYIMKPFHFDELIRKIKHHEEFYNLKVSTESYKFYLRHSFRDLTIPKEVSNLTFPLIIYSDLSSYVDKLILEFSQKKNEIFSFISVGKLNWREKVQKSASDDLIYIKDIHLLTNKDRNELLMLITDKKFLLSTNIYFESHYKTISIIPERIHYNGYEIMKIETYIQFIILKYQYQFPDTVISKKLGFSRKSLYERRLKYNIHKVK